MSETPTTVPNPDGPKTALRDAKGRVLPGAVLNPTGRPKGSVEPANALKRVIRQALEAQSGEGQNLAQILEAMVGRAIAGDVKAAEFLLDRAYGKPAMADEDRDALAPTGNGLDLLRAAALRIA